MPCFSLFYAMDFYPIKGGFHPQGGLFHLFPIMALPAEFVKFCSQHKSLLGSVMLVVAGMTFNNPVFPER